MNKNWNDRADKDLFFTILNVKNIGVIGGHEWTTIGNHMRSLGYGFTNEGCRQHFQGLRRAQHKAALNGEANPAVPRTTDPAINPITRRPGPGRGRPRKNAANAAARAGVGAGATAAAAPNPADGTAPANLAGSVPAGGAASGDVSAAASQVPVTVVQQTPVPLPPTVAVNTDAKVGVGVEGVEDVGVVGEVGEDDVDTSGMEPPSAKRARLDYQAPAPQPQAQGAEEEAVLALAAHTTSEDAYAEEYGDV